MTNADSSDPLWQTIREEAQAAADEDPVLGSFFHASVLNHTSLAASLAYVLAGKLESQAIPPMLIRKIVGQALASDVEISDSLRADMQACRTRDPACDTYLMPLLYFKGFHALQSHRVAHWLWLDGRKSMAYMLASRVASVFDVDIHPGAQIGAGVMIDHATGIVIGETAVIGDSVSMLHGVTLGGSGTGSDRRHPHIANGVLIAAGAKLLGPISVGENAKVGAGSVVLEDVPAQATVAGVPAAVVGVQGRSQPALDMDQGF